MLTSLDQFWYSAASGIYARQRQMEVISHNIANANTVGFRASRPGFQAVIRERVLSDQDASLFSEANPGDRYVEGLGAAFTHTLRDFNQGALQESGGEFHLAIAGDGFFQLQAPNGELVYTRAGDLQLDANGDLVNRIGYRLAPSVQIPSDTVNAYVDKRGSVWIQREGDEVPETIGTIQVALFPNPDGLKNIGENFFLPTEASGEAALGVAGEEGRGALLQGYLEGSNVDLGEQLVETLRAQRAYSLSLRSLYIADEMYRLVNELQRT